jgi:Ca-activated chloride channel family protein
MQFIQPAWLFLAPVPVLAWIFFRSHTDFRWLFFCLLLIAAVAEPVLWLPDETPEGAVKSLQKGTSFPIQYLGMRSPPNLREGESFSARIFLETTGRGTGNARLFHNGILVEERNLEFSSGRQELIFPGIVAAGPLMVLDCWIDFMPDAGGSKISNSENPLASTIHAQAAYAVGGALDVVVVGNNPSPPTGSSTVGGEGGIRFRFVRAEELVTNPGAVFPADVVLLNDVALGELPDALWSSLSEWVLERGGSILKSGGPVLAANSLEDDVRTKLFPLKFQPPDEEEDARAVLVVLDRSGSMAQKVGDNTKMALANEGTLRVATALRPGDWFGVLAVDVSPLWILPLAPWRDNSESKNAIRAIAPGGGGIYIDTALRESWNQLRNAVPLQRHLLVFADADDVEEKSEGEMGGRVGGTPTLDLATLMRADQITISVVALGFENDKDTPWLRELAGRGRGRFHRTEDARQLPGLFTLEADEAGLTRREELPFFAAPTALGLPLFRDINWEESPPLLDQNPATARNGAEVWMEGKKSLPLLAYWRQGRGQVASWATSWQGEWGVEWNGWADAMKFRSALLRWLAPVGDQGNWEVLIVENEPEDLLITLRWLDASKVPPAQPPKISIATTDGQQFDVDWALIGVGHWQAGISTPVRPVLLEGIVGAHEQIPLTIWNPSQIPAPEVETTLQAAQWRKPIPLRPWILAFAVAWLAATGPFGFRKN